MLMEGMRMRLRNWLYTVFSGAVREGSAIVVIFTAIFAAVTIPAAAQDQTIVLRAKTILDGRGHVLHDKAIVIEGGKIVRIESQATGAHVYDLGDRTVMPGWIDCHVHISWHFGPDGKLAGAGVGHGETPERAFLAMEANAWDTLMGGFTTVQSVGSEADVPLRDAIARGEIPGPRILTAVRPLSGHGAATGTPDEIRRYVDEDKAMGADLIKIFASQSIRQGGGMTLSQEQLNAACDEAHKDGLRTLVHAYGDAVKASVLAGCTEVEHGMLTPPSDLKLMAEHGTYFDPQAGLVFENYFDNAKHYVGVGAYSEEGFDAMRKVWPSDLEMIKAAAHTPGLKVVFGTDAVAGADGHNAEEFIDRVEKAGWEPMQALVSANYTSAESMNLQNEIGSIAPGLDADIIAVDGNPLTDIHAVRNVVFVMKGGKIYKNLVPEPTSAHRSSTH
jgi:imidazolonepropionase-like amidohydrolase